MIRLFVVDDHAVVRRGLKQIVEESRECRIVGEASTADEALTRLRDTPCDIVVLDVSLPDRNGLDLLKQIKAEHPRLTFLMLTMHAEEQYAIRAFKAGAAGYLTKESAPEQLLLAVKRIANGRRYMSVELADRLAGQLGGDPNKLPHERLSDREFQVLCLIAKGKGLSEIANELGVSVKTISTHRTRLLEKMCLKSNAELVQYAVKNGLVL